MVHSPYIYHKNEPNAGRYTILYPMGMKIYVITLQVMFSILEIKREFPCFHVIQKKCYLLRSVKDWYLLRAFAKNPWRRTSKVILDSSEGCLVRENLRVPTPPNASPPRNKAFFLGLLTIGLPYYLLSIGFP